MADRRIRQAVPGDEAEAAELANRLSREFYGRSETTPEDVARWWTDPQTEAWVAVDALGHITAYVALSRFADGSRIFLRLRHGGGGEEQLLAVAEARARELARPGALLRPSIASVDEPSRRLFEGAGYKLVRHWFHMRLDLANDARTDPVWPTGIRVRTFVPAEDDERVYATDMEAFADHWDFFPIEYDRWRHWSVDRPEFDPSLWFLAEEGDEVAGISLGEVASSEPDVGVVETLAVRRPWRRRGLARALLLHSFAAMRDRGLSEARLAVDSENPTGALALYEGVGMTVDRRYDTYEKAL